MSGTPTKLVLTRPLRVLIGVVIGGTMLVAGIGFAGSYAAVQTLAVKKGFGDFAYVFPIGIDAGIVVLLALDLMMTWLRIRFPLLRHVAWVLTAATIAFNGAVAWPDPLGVSMHAVIPLLFVVVIEAARHGVGRIADITADKHMDGVRVSRWVLAPWSTLLLWRRMKLWEIRDYDTVVRLERDRLTFHDHLQDECEARIQAALEGKTRGERRAVSRDWRKHLTAGERRILRDTLRGIPIPEEALRRAVGSRPTPSRPPGAESVQSDHLCPARPNPTQSWPAVGTDRVGAPALESATRPDSTDSTDAGRVGEWDESDESNDRVGSGPHPTDSGPGVGSGDPTESRESNGIQHPTDPVESGESVGPDPHPTPQVNGKSVGAVGSQRLNPTRTPDPTDSEPTAPEPTPALTDRPDPTNSLDPEPSPEEDDEVADPLPDPIPQSLLDLLERARRELVDWPTSDLTEDKVRRHLRVGATRARFVRDQLKAEREAAKKAAAPVAV